MRDNNTNNSNMFIYKAAFKCRHRSALHRSRINLKANKGQSKGHSRQTTISNRRQHKKQTIRIKQNQIIQV